MSIWQLEIHVPLTKKLIPNDVLEIKRYKQFQPVV